MAKVYIGVGHGGSDPGAVSGKHKESAYALDIATACTAELKRHGVTVMQSRTSDVYESAAAKITECNKYNPGLALDIHLNAGGGDGFEVFHSINSNKGRQLAQNIETEVKAIGQNSRGVKTRLNKSGKDYFGFIRQTNCTALLVECAFIDSTDVNIVDTLSERQAFGQAIARGILSYLGIAYKAEATSGSSASITVGEVAVLLPQLQRGASNMYRYQVERIQLCLNQMGYTGADGKALTVDGDFGANTEAAIKKLQKRYNIEQTGTMTAKTWRALISLRG